MSNEQQAVQDTTTAAGSSQDPAVAAAPATAAPETKVDAAPANQTAKTAESGNEPAKQEAKKEETKAESSLELKLPEGSILDAGAVERIAAYAKERGLTNDQAQELLNRESENVANYAKAQEDHVKAQVDGWKAAVEKDKELGGDAYSKNVELAKRVVTKYGSEDFLKTLNDTGLGNHPELVRVFFRIGRAMGEDKLVVPNAQASQPRRPIEDVFYGNKQT